jgi:hypothetical protein
MDTTIESNREFAAGVAYVHRPQFSGQAVALPTTKQALDDVGIAQPASRRAKDTVEYDSCETD